MKGLKRLSPSLFETGDYVALVSDSHIFSQKDLSNGREEELLGDISSADESKLLMSDAQLINLAAISQLPTFRSMLTKRENLTRLHERKYQFKDGVVVLKDNAGMTYG